jgi:Sec-independent protein secretion pathway component TatC
MFTMLLMAIPLIVLYEIGIGGAKFFGRARKPATDDTNVDDSDSGIAEESKGL